MPGAMVTEGIAEFCKPFMTSFVLGRDLVPRLSFDNLRKIRDDVLDLIARCKVNKTQVLRSVKSKDPDLLEKFLYPPGKEPDSEFRRQLKVSFRGIMPTLKKPSSCFFGGIAYAVK